MFGRYVPVRAEVVGLECFSVHADADELLRWLRSTPAPPDVVYVVHGEPASSDALCGRLSSELGWNAAVPDHDERVRVD
jgi:metallo-beta-lactamase family protein